MAFWYFGYGSNMDLQSMRAKGVEPSSSERGTLHGWRLRFNVGHFFRHEGGVANIVPGETPDDRVQGVLHLCDDPHLDLLDAAEAYAKGYDRIEVPVKTQGGEIPAIAYVGMPAFIDDSCLPTQRYINILGRGAELAGLDPDYIDALRGHPVRPHEVAPPFVPPAGHFPTFSADSLAQLGEHTALAGSVFDMSGARAKHDFLRGLFGGKDMTLFHLKRMDSSDGRETMDDLRLDRLTAAQRQYLDAYLQEYAAEYAYAGRYDYG